MTWWLKTAVLFIRPPARRLLFCAAKLNVRRQAQAVRATASRRRDSRKSGGQPRAARRAFRRGTHAAAQGGGRHLLSRRGATPPAREGQRQAAQGRETVARRLQAPRNRHPQTAPRKSLHHAECFSAERFRAGGSQGQSRFPRSRRAAELLHLQTGLFDHPPFLRPALPGVRGAEFSQAHRDGGFARTRGAAHRRAREDRLSGRHQTAARGRATHRHARVFRATRRCVTPPSRISRTGDIGWRFSDSICATRRAWRRFASIC